MFSRPNREDNQYTISDFLEYKCIKTDGEIPALAFRSLLSMSDDEVNNEGIESSDDKSVIVLDDAIAECSNRLQRCPDRYPFVIGCGSLGLKSNTCWHKDIYAFLLLVTRIDMKNNRMQGGYDGTRLFEELCAKVIEEYFGCHSEVMVFGTSQDGKFNEKVKEVLRRLNIRGQFKIPYGSTGHQRDAHVDILAWIPFTDKKDGQMIALGQCKTGTSWESKLTELDPDVFFSCYSTQQPFSKPIKMFFVSESFGDYKWEERCSYCGILFDRTRIMEYLPHEIDEDLLDKIRMWNAAAIVAEEIED